MANRVDGYQISPLIGPDSLGRYTEPKRCPRRTLVPCRACDALQGEYCYDGRARAYRFAHG